MINSWDLPDMGDGWHSMMPLNDGWGYPDKMWTPQGYAEALLKRIIGYNKPTDCVHNNDYIVMGCCGTPGNNEFVQTVCTQCGKLNKPATFDHVYYAILIEDNGTFSIKIEEVQKYYECDRPVDWDSNYTYMIPRKRE